MTDPLWVGHPAIQSHGCIPIYNTAYRLYNTGYTITRLYKCTTLSRPAYNDLSPSLKSRKEKKNVKNIVPECRGYFEHLGRKRRKETSGNVYHFGVKTASSFADVLRRQSFSKVISCGIMTNNVQPGANFLSYSPVIQPLRSFSAEYRWIPLSVRG